MSATGPAIVEVDPRIQSSTNDNGQFRFDDVHFVGKRMADFLERFLSARGRVSIQRASHVEPRLMGAGSRSSFGGRADTRPIQMAEQSTACGAALAFDLAHSATG